jgi:hypothetical protein
MFWMACFLSSVDEHLPIINKTQCTQERGRKAARWNNPSPSKRKSSKEGGLQGEWEQIKYSEPPLVMRSILDKERGQTFERMLSLEEPSLTITTRFDIEIACTHCNTTNTLCL